MGTIDLNDLPVFVAVAEAESFSRAAKRLGIPKSSVSRAIASLEGALGVRLVHRTTRHVSLSTAGQTLYGRVETSLSTLQKSIGELPELDAQPSGRLRVTASVDMGAALLASIATRFTARYPSIELECVLTNAYVDLVNESIDIALRISSKPLADSTLSARKIGPLSLGIYASPTYLARAGTPRKPQDLQAHSWVVFNNIRSLRLEGPGTAVKLEPRGRIRCDELSFASAAVVRGAGIGVLPTFLVSAECASGALVRVLPRWHMPSGSLYLVVPNAKHLPAKVIAFRDFMLDPDNFALPSS